ncbi:MAG TPA: aminopeptidase [Thermodesulfobacteriota bacterium]|nr:aminopeptidase [Thermodesulfobacteriota bacterium]
METPDKDTLKEMQDRLTMTPRLLWDHLEQAERDAVETFADGYKQFLDQAKTEREAVLEVERQALANGFVDLYSGQSGSKFILNYRGKTVALAVLGQRPVRQGLRILAAHIDSPRLDLKQNPLYEEADLVFLKTHYYGGIKKYQWLARPLALHGVIFKENGEAITLRLGEDPADPVFTVCDLLPHLARKVQMDKKVDEAFIGEKLNLLVGSLPLGDKETKERFKLHLLNLLFERYGLMEEDLISAELEAVPAGPARDIGWDRSLVGGYGQDDRAAAYPALQAILDLENPLCACLTFLVDKEEVGSSGNTSAQSVLLEELVAQLLERQGESASQRRQALMLSQAISGDVAAALDPDWPEVYEKRNAARLGYGVVLTKFTGHGGKYHANDAHAEYVHLVRKIFNENGVIWQAAELGKIDEGGGGTIAKFLAAYGMDIVDCGPALLSMHSPFEIGSKADLYMTYKAFRSFLVRAP